jgi:hypothetical protein
VPARVLSRPRLPWALPVDLAAQQELSDPVAGAVDRGVTTSRQWKTKTVNATNDVVEFLATRRAKITPEQAGLPSYGKRRVPGPAQSR